MNILISSAIETLINGNKSLLRLIERTKEKKVSYLWIFSAESFQKITLFWEKGIEFDIPTKAIIFALSKTSTIQNGHLKPLN